MPHPVPYHTIVPTRYMDLKSPFEYSRPLFSLRCAGVGFGLGSPGTSGSHFGTPNFISESHMSQLHSSLREHCVVLTKRLLGFLEGVLTMPQDLVPLTVHSQDVGYCRDLNSSRCYGPRFLVPDILEILQKDADSYLDLSLSLSLDRGR